MCTLAVYLREFDDYPLVVAANRDEHFSRPTAPPELLANDPSIFGGKDLVAGGTWLGVNALGLTAGIVNRRAAHTQSRETVRSRGLLCLDMLRAKDATQARERLERELGSAYQPFILLVASEETAFVAFNTGGEIQRLDLDAGLHVFSNTSFTDSGGGKLDQARELFAAAANSLGTRLKRSRAQLDSAVEVLRGVLSSHDSANHSQEPRDTICVHKAGADYGTVSSSIIFYARDEKKFHFYHASGPPCRTGYQAVEVPEFS
jgi:uncharacterized protein with NRDE domain